MSDKTCLLIIDFCYRGYEGTIQIVERGKMVLSKMRCYIVISQAQLYVHLYLYCIICDVFWHLKSTSNNGHGLWKQVNWKEKFMLRFRLLLTLTALYQDKFNNVVMRHNCV